MVVADTRVAARHAGGRLRVCLALVVIAWGAQAIVTQSLLLREALVLMYGSEFSWGIVLFAWLLGVALGACIGGRWAERVGEAEVGLAIVLLGLSLLACVDLWVFRGARVWLGAEPGEFLPLPKTILAALLFVSPAGAFVGMAFPFAACLRAAGEPHARRGVSSTSTGRGFPSESGDDPRRVLPLGVIYAIESAGSLIGGAAFSFWAVEHLAPIQTALVCAALTTLSLAVLWVFGKRRLFGGVVLSAPAVACLALAAFAGDELEEGLVQRRWRTIAPGYELKAHAETKYQSLAIGQRAEQYTLYSNGFVASDFPDPYTFVPLAHYWLCQHPEPARVLVLGGGAEGLVAEIRKHNVQHVDYVEPDPRQIELLGRYLADADRRALDDPRVQVHHVDGRHFIKGTRFPYDLVIARLPEPVSALNARFYTREFFQELRQAMAPKSVLCLVAAAGPGQLSADSAEYLASIRATLKQSFPYVVVGWGNPAHIFAATGPGMVSTDPAVLMQRYMERGVESAWFDPLWFEGATDWLDPAKVEQRRVELDAVVDPQVSTDLHPVVYLQRLALWERMTGGTQRGVIGWLRTVRWMDVIVGLLGMVGLTLVGSYIGGRVRGRAVVANGTSGIPHAWLADGAIVLSIASTGLVTMALSIIWLFAFQSMYGYVYSRIGWIIALFMAGLVFGCGFADWRLERRNDISKRFTYPWRWLIVVDLLLVVLCVLVPRILTSLSTLQTTASAFFVVESSVSMMVLLTGVLGGAAFALAARLHLAMTGRWGLTAGAIVGADHAGACIGALLSGILLVPVLGIVVTAWLLAGVKMGSVVFLVAARRLSRAA